MRKNIFRQLSVIAWSSVLLLGVTCMLSSCEEDLKPYDEPDGLGRVYFLYGNGKVDDTSADSLVSYSFIYHNNVPSDTIWLRVCTAGFLSSVDRYLELEQVTTGVNDAISGTHYMSFDDPAYKQLLRVPADSLRCNIPVIVYNHPTLQNGDVTLKVKLKATSSLLLGYEDFLTKRINISAVLSKPVNWNMLCDWYLGDYGKVKHQFMIDVSGDPWDDDYLLNVAHVNDYSYQDFLRYKATRFSKALAELNAQRAAQGLDPLAEENGALVTFPF